MSAPRLSRVESEARGLLRRIYKVKAQFPNQEYRYALLNLLALALKDGAGDYRRAPEQLSEDNLKAWGLALETDQGQEELQQALLAVVQKERLELPLKEQALAELAPSLVEQALDRLNALRLS
jgi:hypothetical protein